MKREIRLINDIIARGIEELDQWRKLPDSAQLEGSEKGWVYAFVDEGKILYVGITCQTLSQRRQGHIGGYRDCPFAHALAQRETGRTGRNKELLKDHEYEAAYDLSRDRVRKMKRIAVRETDGHKRHLLEVAASIAFKTLNKF